MSFLNQNARLRVMVDELRSLLSSEQEQLEAEQAAMLDRLRDEIASTSRRRMRALASTVDLVEREVSEIVATNSESVSTRATRMLEIAAAEDDLAHRFTSNADATARLAVTGEKVSHTRPRGRSSPDVDCLAMLTFSRSRFDRLSPLDCNMPLARQSRCGAARLEHVPTNSFCSRTLPRESVEPTLPVSIDTPSVSSEALASRTELAIPLCTDARDMRYASEAGKAALRATLSSTADVLGDWKDSVNRSEQDAYSTILSAASDVRNDSYTPPCHSRSLADDCSLSRSNPWIEHNSSVWPPSSGKPIRRTHKCAKISPTVCRTT